ncbi:Auxin response factor, partial [Thalictrum thalictroides]
RQLLCEALTMSTQMRISPSGFSNQTQEGRCMNSELWHACAGPLVSLPSVGSHVVYFPQGHSEQIRSRYFRFDVLHVIAFPQGL